ncbi:hypothetical protein TH47_06575 [Thalassospira sp. MCCC 1A02803]|nr:hypothetical protein AUQ41_04090 [Thalassospira sp. MCCC 1A02898]ONH88285.1 hypothetical protein TH47_06575 [Thalassospira sp. MCCC 1A02803]
MGSIDCGDEGDKGMLVYVVWVPRIRGDCSVHHNANVLRIKMIQRRGRADKSGGHAALDFSSACADISK